MGWSYCWRIATCLVWAMDGLVVNDNCIYDILTELELINIQIIDLFRYDIRIVDRYLHKKFRKLSVTFDTFPLNAIGVNNTTKLSTPPIVALYSTITSGFSMFCFVWKCVLPVSTSLPVCFVDIIDTIFTFFVLYASFHRQIISLSQNFTLAGSPYPFTGFHDQKSSGKPFFYAECHMNRFHFATKHATILVTYKGYLRPNCSRHCINLQEGSVQPLMVLNMLQRVWARWYLELDSLYQHQYRQWNLKDNLYYFYTTYRF